MRSQRTTRSTGVWHAGRAPGGETRSRPRWRSHRFHTPGLMPFAAFPAAPSFSSSASWTLLPGRLPACVPGAGGGGEGIEVGSAFAGVLVVGGHEPTP